MDGRADTSAGRAWPIDEAPALPRKRWADRLRALRGDALAARSRRVILLVVGLWILNLFDLNFTILACRIGDFKELNPLASGLLNSPRLLSVFKIALLSLSTGVFLVFRRRALTEAGCWLLFGVYSVLSFMWMQYFLPLE